MRVHAVEQARFVGGIGQEQAHLIGDVVAPDHEPRVATGGIEFGQLLAQQNEDQADRETERAALHQARHVRRVRHGRALAQIGIALSFVEDQFQSDHAAIVAHARLQVEQTLPKGLGALAIQHALEQADQHRAESVVVVH